MQDQTAYTVNDSTFYLGKTEEVLAGEQVQSLKGKVDLIFFSPPFPLNRKKKYGNYQGDEYKLWLAEFAVLFKSFLSPTGSIVIELGNSWEPGSPTMSTLALESLLDFKKAADLHLCQQFIWSNPAKLPTPAQWVNIDRVRVKDSFTHIWWLSPSENPKADNRRVLREYSDAMKNLIKTQRYNPGKRHSEHHIGETSFLTDNGGSIPPSVLEMSNTGSSSAYLKYCKKVGIKPHPARMPIGIPEFFIRFLTEPGDLVMDPFAGSGTTCEAAEELGRQWIGIEANTNYVKGSKGRFPSLREESVDHLS